MTTDPDDDLNDAVRKRRERRAQWEREGERSIAQNLAMIGSLGWMIVAPTIAGVFIGRWLDGTFSMRVFWTLGLMVLGLAIGCALAWQRMHHD
jgi:ATP synthase protein I